MLSAGQNLRALRERLGLTMRDVETSSAAIAEKHKSDEFAIPPSRLSDMETKGVVPSIYRLYSLSVIYRKDAREILTWYGVDMNTVAEDIPLASPPKSHKSEALENVSSVRIPVRMDPSFDPRYTANMGRLVEQWGVVPLTYLDNSPTADTPTATSERMTLRCTRFCRRGHSCKSTNRKHG